MLPRSWIDALFKKFEGMYGNSFSNKWHGLDVENIKNTWADVLGGLSGDQIKAGLEECAKSCSHAPSAPEFYQLCRVAKVPAIHQPLQLDKKREEISPENKARLDEIKRQLLAKVIVNAEDDA